MSSLINQISDDKIMRVLWASGTIGAANGATASSYTPPYRLPSFPDPLDQKLEDASTAYSIVSGDGTQSYGHFENRIHFAPGDASSYFQGAYPRHDGGAFSTSSMLVSSYDGDFQDAVTTNMIVSAATKSLYNSKSSMDRRGYISTMYGAPDMATQSKFTGRVYVSGSVVNGLTGATSQVSQPTVAITTRIALGDITSLNLYGGLHQIGLWSMDTPKALLENEAPFLEGDPDPGVDPSFIDADGITKQEYRLFAKKTFTDDLTRIEDVGSAAGYQSYRKRF